MLALAIYTSSSAPHQHHWKDDDYYLQLTNTTQHHEYKHLFNCIWLFINSSINHTKASQAQV
jgi:hypothetical protein